MEIGQRGKERGKRAATTAVAAAAAVLAVAIEGGRLREKEKENINRHCLRVEA